MIWLISTAMVLHTMFFNFILIFWKKKFKQIKRSWTKCYYKQYRKVYAFKCYDYSIASV